MALTIKAQGDVKLWSDSDYYGTSDTGGNRYYSATTRLSYIIYEPDYENRVTPVDIHVYNLKNENFGSPMPGSRIYLYNAAMGDDAVAVSANYKGSTVTNTRGVKEVYDFYDESELTFENSGYYIYVDGVKYYYRENLMSVTNKGDGLYGDENIVYARINIPHDSFGDIPANSNKFTLKLVPGNYYTQSHFPSLDWDNYGIAQYPYTADNYTSREATITLPASAFENLGIAMPIITGASDFYDTGNPWVSYICGLDNEATSCQLYATIDGEVVIQRRDMDQDAAAGKVYTIELTDEERTAIREIAYNVDRKEIIFCLETIYDGKTYTSRLTKEVVIIAANPTLEITLEDTSPETTYLTKDPLCFVKFFSDVHYEVNATAYSGAEIAEITVHHNGQTRTWEYVDYAEGVFENVETDSFTFTVTDTRGNVTIKVLSAANLDFRMTNYKKLTCDLKANPPTTSGVISIAVTGNWFGDNTFNSNKPDDAVRNNLVVLYRYREKGKEWGEWITIDNVEWLYEATGTPYDYEGTIEIEGFDYMKTYIFQARAYDMLMTVDSATKTLKTFPVYDWGDDDFKFNVPVYVKDMNTGTKYNLSGAAKALFNSYQLETTTTPGSNYTSTNGSAVLLGNSLRCNIYAARSAASGGGNITNETVCSVSIKHDGKIKSAYRIAFGNGATGSTASLATANEMNDGTNLTFDVVLAATASSLTEISTFFIIPCTLDLDAY